VISDDMPKRLSCITSVTTTDAEHSTSYEGIKMYFMFPSEQHASTYPNVHAFGSEGQSYIIKHKKIRVYRSREIVLDAGLLPSQEVRHVC